MYNINGTLWRIQYVDGRSSYLRRSDGSWTVGMTDGGTNTIYLYKGLHGAFLDKVLCHELVHVFMFSYGIEIDIEQEEFMADFFSTHGRAIIYLLDDIMQQQKMAR